MGHTVINSFPQRTPSARCKSTQFLKDTTSPKHVITSPIQKHVTTPIQSPITNMRPSSAMNHYSSPGNSSFNTDIVSQSLSVSPTKIYCRGETTNRFHNEKSTPKRCDNGQYTKSQPSSKLDTNHGNDQVVMNLFPTNERNESVNHVQTENDSLQGENAKGRHLSNIHNNNTMNNHPHNGLKPIIAHKRRSISVIDNRSSKTKSVQFSQQVTTFGHKPSSRPQSAKTYRRQSTSQNKDNLLLFSNNSEFHRVRQNLSKANGQIDRIDRPSSPLFDPFPISSSSSPSKWYGHMVERINNKWLDHAIDKMNRVADQYVNYAVKSYNKEIEEDVNNERSDDVEKMDDSPQSPQAPPQSLEHDSPTGKSKMHEESERIVTAEVVKEKASLLLLKHITGLVPKPEIVEQINEKWNKCIEEFIGSNATFPRTIKKRPSTALQSTRKHSWDWNLQKNRPQSAVVRQNETPSNSPSNVRTDAHFDDHFSTLASITSSRTQRRPVSAHLQTLLSTHTHPSSRNSALLTIRPISHNNIEGLQNFSPRISDLLKKYNLNEHSPQTPQEETIQRRYFQHEAVVTKMRMLRRQNAERKMQIDKKII